MLVSIIIIKLIINLISLYYYSCSAYYCNLRLKICLVHSLENLKTCVKIAREILARRS